VIDVGESTAGTAQEQAYGNGRVPQGFAGVEDGEVASTRAIETSRGQRGRTTPGIATDVADLHWIFDAAEALGVAPWRCRVPSWFDWRGRSCDLRPTVRC